MKESSEPSSQGNCHFCAKRVTEDDYCYGCKVFVCETCEQAGDLITGPHDPKLHQGDVPEW